MKKSIMNIDGVRLLGKSEIKAINGKNNDCYGAYGVCDYQSLTFRMFEYCMYYLGCGPEPV